MCTVRCGGLGCGEVTEERNGVVPGRVLAGSGVEGGWYRGGAVEGHGNGVVPGRVLGDTEGGPGVREAQRVLGGGRGGWG